MNLEFVVLIGRYEMTAISDCKVGDGALTFSSEYLIKRHVRTGLGKNGQVMAGTLENRITHFLDRHRFQLPLLQHIGTSIQATLQTLDALLPGVIPLLCSRVPAQQPA